MLPKQFFSISEKATEATFLTSLRPLGDMHKFLPDAGVGNTDREPAFPFLVDLGATQHTFTHSTTRYAVLCEGWGHGVRQGYRHPSKAGMVQHPLQTCPSSLGRDAAYLREGHMPTPSQPDTWEPCVTDLPPPNQPHWSLGLLWNLFPPLYTDCSIFIASFWD